MGCVLLGFFWCQCEMLVVSHWLALDLESFVELGCCSLYASHPFFLPFIYLLFHIKQKGLILKCLFREGKKGSLLIVAAALLCEAIPSVSLICKGRLGMTLGVEVWRARIVRCCLYSTVLATGGLMDFQQSDLVHGWFGIASYNSAIGNVLD